MNASIAFVLPSFTISAYDNSFYPFFVKYSKVTKNETVSTDLDLLSNEVPNKEASFNSHRSNGLHYLNNHISSFLPDAKLNYLTDEDVHNGLIFNVNNGNNKYDIMILGHQEYVSEQEYQNFKKFVAQGGALIFLNSNTFYAEVEYDPEINTISLVKGHYWGFDGEKAWRDVKERWADETTEWMGSNFGCFSCVITFNNNPFDYKHHEENYVTNSNVNILIRL